MEKITDDAYIASGAIFTFNGQEYVAGTQYYGSKKTEKVTFSYPTIKRDDISYTPSEKSLSSKSIEEISGTINHTANTDKEIPFSKGEYMARVSIRRNPGWICSAEASYSIKKYKYDLTFEPNW